MKTTIFVILTLFLLLSCENTNLDSADSKNITESEVKAENKSAPISKVIEEANHDQFNEAIQELYTEFQYRSEDSVANKLYKVDKKKFLWIIDRFKRCSDTSLTSNLPVCGIDFELIKKVKKSFVKAEKPFKDHLYLKASIQEWSFENESSAESFENELNECITHKECVNKGGITWWRVKDRMYVITTPAYRYSFEFEEIKKVMNRKLK